MRRNVCVSNARDRRDNSEDASLQANWSWAIVFGVFLIQLCVPSLVSAYGVLLMHLVGHKVTLYNGILPPIFFTAAWFFADPLCKKVVTGYSLSANYTAITGVLIVAAGLATNALFQTIPFQIISFGIIGGIGTSLVVQQAEAVLFCHFPSQRGLVIAVGQVGTALGQFCIPLLLNGLITLYGTHGALLVQAGVVLHAAIGAALLLPPDDGPSGPPLQRRPRSYTLFDDVEMTDLSSWSNNCHSGNSPLLSSTRSWRNPAITTDSDNDVPMSSPVIVKRRKNVYGVDILPEIPEECEDSDDNNDSTGKYEHLIVERRESVINWNKIILALKEDEDDTNEDVLNKSLSDSEDGGDNNVLRKWESLELSNQDDETNTEVISSAIDSVSKGNDICHVNNSIFKINISEDNEENSSNVSPALEHINSMDFSTKLHSSNVQSENIQFRFSFSHKLRKQFHCGCCNWYCRYKFYTAVFNVPNNVYMSLIIPLLTAVKVSKFIPALCTNTVVKLCPVVFTTLIPSMTRGSIVDSSEQEAAFTVSVSGFTWLCFLVMSPCFSGLKPNGQKTIYLGACLISSIGLYLLSASHSHNFIILGCAIFGLGHGATMAIGPVVIEEELGVRDAVMIQGPMDVLSGCLVLLVAVILGVLLRYAEGVSHCFILVAVLQAMSGLMWITLLLKSLIGKCRCFHSNLSQWPANGEYMTPG